MLAALAAAALAGALLGMAGPGSAALGADSPGTTTIYRWVDAKGVVHYTDSPQPGAQQLHVPPAQTYRAPPVRDVPVGSPAGEAAPSYEACLIAQPASQHSFYAPEQVIVNIELVPALRAGDRLTVTADGSALAPADPSGLNFAIQAPDRGAHTVTAVVHDPSGRAACRAPPVTFYVRRPSLLSPLSPQRGRSVPGVPGVPAVPGVPHAAAPLPRPPPPPAH